MRTIADAKILLIDDDQDILEVLREWLRLFNAEIDTASNGLEALHLIKQHVYDVVITDLRMPMLNGLQLLSILKNEVENPPEVIFLTGEGTMEDAITALREGRAFDFMLKPIRDYQQLNQAIERALAQRERTLAAQETVRPMSVPEHVESLTPRELEIVGLLGEGLDNREIADRLFLSEKTIKNHLTRIYEKLKVGNRTQAVLNCKSYGLIK